MNRKEFVEAFEALDPSDPDLEHIDLKDKLAEYEALLIPAVSIERDEAEAVSGQSKFGGRPDLPSGTAWPSHPDFSYRFIAQFNFGDIENATSMGLPEDGILSLFAAEAPDEDLSGQEEGYVTAIYSPAGSELQATEPSQPTRVGAEVALNLQSGIDSPRDPDHRDSWPTEDPYDAIDLLGEWLEANATDAHLLGYPTVGTLADPTPGPEWVTLLTLSSDDELNWLWGDGDFLYVMIKRDALAKGDFSNLSSLAG